MRVEQYRRGQFAWTLRRSREFRMSTFGEAVERARVAVNPDAANAGGQQEDACRADDDGGSADCSPHSVMQLQHRLGEARCWLR